MIRYHFTNPRKGDYDLSEVEVYMICNKSAAETAVSYLYKEPVLYVDTEGEYLGNRDPLALIQIATGPKRCFIFDIVEYEDSVFMLRDIFESKGITKVFHDCSGDSARLYQYGISLRNVFDTLVAEEVRQPHLEGGINKNYLSITYCGKDMKNKTTQSIEAQCGIFLNEYSETRWFKRPLKDGDVAYAAVDVLFLSAVFRKQKLQIPDWQKFSVQVEEKIRSRIPANPSRIPATPSIIPATPSIIPATPSRIPATKKSCGQKQELAPSFNWGGALSIGAAVAVGVAVIGGAIASASDSKSTVESDRKKKKDDECIIS